MKTKKDISNARRIEKGGNESGSDIWQRKWRSSEGLPKKIMNLWVSSQIFKCNFSDYLLVRKKAYNVCIAT